MQLTKFKARKSRISSSAQNKGTGICTEVKSSPSTIHSGELSLPDTPSQGVFSLGVSPTQGPRTNKDLNEWQTCGCTPICLPLIALISTLQARFDKKLLTALVDWAYTVSWGSFCSEHLMRLAQFITGEDPRGRTRAEAIQNLEAFCSRGCYSSISTGDFPFMTDWVSNIC